MTSRPAETPPASSLDLVQIRTFVHLYETRSVTAAAELMHVTQPSVSYTLGKLRRRFEDALFVRSAGGMEPTPTAKSLFGPFRSALESIDRAVAPDEDFDPAGSEREFTMMLSEFGELSFLPLLLGRLAEIAPRARLVVLPLVVDRAGELLTRGQLDLAITSVELPEELLVRRRFMSVDYVGLIGSDHPRLSGDALVGRALAGERFVSVRGTSGHEGPVQLLHRLGLDRRVELELSNFAAVPYVVAETSLVAIVPRHIAEVFSARHAVRALELPWEVDPIEVAAYTSRRASPAGRWFAAMVVDTLSTRRLR